MVAHLIGGLLRAALVVIVIAIPAFLLPGVTVSAQEITLIVAGIAAAFTIFEYASTHPGLIDFRFAPPYNRMRYIAFTLLVLSLSFLVRASAGLDSFSPGVLRLADHAVALAVFPMSPVSVAVEAVSRGTEPELQMLIERSASVAFVVSVELLGAFGLLLWLLRWPVGRRDFNLWLNLPTFTPGPPLDAERRLFRDAAMTLAAALMFLYLVPPLLTGAVAVVDANMLRNPQILVWATALWGFVSGSLLIRGIAMFKVAWLVRRTRLG